MNRVVNKEGYTEYWFHNDEDLCAKILSFEQAGVSTSLHYHEKKKEHFLIKQGSFIIQMYMGSREDYLISHEAQTPPSESGASLKLMANVLLHEGEDLHVRRGQIHRLIPLLGNSEVIEFSTHHDDQDSYRVDLKREWTVDELKEIAKYV